MKDLLMLGLLLPAIALAFAASAPAEGATPETSEHLAHVVMFTLKMHPEGYRWISSRAEEKLHA